MRIIGVHKILGEFYTLKQIVTTASFKGEHYRLKVDIAS